MKQEILRHAEDLIKIGGVYRFSFRLLAQKCGIKSSSVHYHFNSKRDLIIAVLENYISNTESALTALEKAEPDQAKRLEKYVQLFLDWAKNGGYEKGCVSIIIGYEMSESDRKIRSMISRQVKFHVDWIAKTVREGQGKNVFKKNVDASLFASSLFQMMEGGATISKITCSGDLIKKGGSYSKFVISEIVV